VLTEDFTFAVDGERLAATRVLARPGALPTVVSFHGHGLASTRARIRYALDALAARGVSSLCFDFSGHGDSTGVIDQATLAKRLVEARAAAALLDPSTPPALVGASMGGAIAAWLTVELRPRAVVLVSPAAYSDEAMSIRFGDGFDSVAKAPGAGERSSVFAALDGLRGRYLVVAAGQDAVIPRAVLERYAAAAPHARARRVLWLDGCPHQVNRWLLDHDAARSRVVEEVFSAVGGD